MKISYKVLVVVATLFAVSFIAISFSFVEAQGWSGRRGRFGGSEFEFDRFGRRGFGFDRFGRRGFGGSDFGFDRFGRRGFGGSEFGFDRFGRRGFGGSEFGFDRSRRGGFGIGDPRFGFRNLGGFGDEFVVLAVEEPSLTRNLQNRMNTLYEDNTAASEQNFDIQAEPSREHDENDKDDSTMQQSDGNVPEPPQPPATCEPRQFFCQIYKFCYPCFQNPNLEQCRHCESIFTCPREDENCQRREVCNLCQSLSAEDKRAMPVCASECAAH